MSQLEDAYFTRFRKFRDTCPATDPDPGSWRRAQIKWGRITSPGLDKIWEAAIPEALKAGDMEALHAAFFQSVRILLLPGAAGGCDHCTNFWHLLDAAVTEGTAELRRILPASLGKASNGHSMLVNGVNLLLCLLHGPEVPFDQEAVMNKAEKFTQTKHPLWERSVVACLLALLRRDMERFSQSLEDVRRSFGREQCAKYMRLQCLNGYGLAVLAHDLLPEEDFQRVRLPEGPSFSPTYLQWRLSLPELPKRLYFTYPEDLDMMNRAIAHPLIVQRIYQPYAGSENPYLSAKDRREWHLDGEGMLEELLAEL